MGQTWCAHPRSNLLSTTPLRRKKIRTRNGVVIRGFRVSSTPDSTSCLELYSAHGHAAAPVVPDTGAVRFARVVVGFVVIAADGVPDGVADAVRRTVARSESVVHAVALCPARVVIGLLVASADRVVQRGADA